MREPMTEEPRVLRCALVAETYPMLTITLHNRMPPMFPAPRAFVRSGPIVDATIELHAGLITAENMLEFLHAKSLFQQSAERIRITIEVELP